MFAILVTYTSRREGLLAGGYGPYDSEEYAAQAMAALQKLPGMVPGNFDWVVMPLQNVWPQFVPATSLDGQSVAPPWKEPRSQM